MTEITTESRIDDGIKMLHDALKHFNEISREDNNNFAFEIARIIMGVLAAIDVINSAYRKMKE